MLAVTSSQIDTFMQSIPKRAGFSRNCCRVYLGRHLEKLREKVAIKIIGKEGNAKVPRKECKILSRLQHQWIIQLLGIFISTSKKKKRQAG